jgi:dihydroneopterin aldolase/2-amino-4-hydroxy-6-hydroxymethyldihydropteridine diphosphokinase/dihydropteroate synthase
MFYDISKCGFSDNIKDTIDYSEVSKKICEYTEESKHYTLEALATGVAKIILFHFNIEEVIIRIDKPSAIYLAKSPAIEIRRNKKFFKNDLIQQKLDSSLNILNNMIIQKDTEHCVYLALGSNIENRYENILRALSELKLFSFIKNTSFLYETPPKYVIEQPKFLNLVCMILTKLNPIELLEKIKQIETKLGRQNTIRYGPRIIDIDILFYDNLIFNIKEPTELIIPHPKLQERDFVLGPFLDLSPNYIHPILNKSILELFKELTEISLKKILPFNFGNYLWKLGDKTFIMGILNITPDSFSDGGKYFESNNAIKRVKEMIELGIDIVDIGGQSTRPGATLISAEEELSRILPILKIIRKNFPNILISIDTFYSKVAKEAIENGANMINDITAGTFDEEMFTICSKLKVPIILMHMKGTPQTMQSLTEYNNLIEEIKQFLLNRSMIAQERGIYRWNIIIDPGIGFAKNMDHNLKILKYGSQFSTLGFPILYGPSRKKFIGIITKKENPSERIMGTAAACTAAIQQGADIIRIHDIEYLKDVILVSDAIYRSKN